MLIKILSFLSLILFWLQLSVTIKAQTDSLNTSKELFALSAADIATSRKLVESQLNKRTITAAQLEQFASDAPATVYVVTKEQIQNRGYENLLDVLDDIPEVEIQRLANPEFNNHISLRGVAGNEKFIILQDGIRISAPTGDTHSIGMNFSIDNAEQVEVIIGPASALYGADAFSGIIQIITKAGRQNYSVRAKTTYGSFHTSHSTLALSQSYGDFSVNLSGTYYTSQEANFPEIYQQDFSWFNERYQPNAELKVTPFLDITQTVDLQGDQRQFEMPTKSYYTNLSVKYKELDLGYNRHGDSYTSCASTKDEFCIYDNAAKFAYSIETIFGRHKFASPNLKWFLESTFSFHTYQLNNQTAFINTYTGYEPGYKMEFGKSKKWKEQLRYSFSSELNLIAGFTYEIIDALPLTGDLPKPFDFSTPTPLQNQYYLGSNFIDQDGNDLSIFQDFYYLHYQNIGTYLQVQNRFSKSLVITTGLRYDRNTRYGESVNPRLGIVWNPSESMNIKMLYGESLLSPSPRKSNSHFGSFFAITNSNGAITGLASNFFHLSNPDLEPEKLRSLEGSIRYVLSNNIVFTLNAYYTRINNLINKFALNSEITSFKNISIPNIETSLNEGNANIYGSTAKLEGVYNLSGTNVNFYLNYSYSNGNSNDEPLLYNAKHTIKAGLEISNQVFSLAPRFIYRSTSYSIIKDELGQFIGNDPYWIVNFFGKVKILNKENMKLSLYTKINNLFDKRYYNGFLGGLEGYPVVPQNPINGTFGIEVMF